MQWVNSSSEMMTTHPGLTGTVLMFVPCVGLLLDDPRNQFGFGQE